MEIFDWQQFELETDRLYLKKITPTVLKQLFEKHSKEFIIDFLGLQNEKEWEREQERIVGGYQTHDRTYLAFVMVLKENHQTIGRSGYHHWYPKHYRAELGYALNHDKHKQQGYMKEAVKAIIDYGFENMNLRRIEAYVGPTNEASLKIMMHFNFQQEGYLKKHYVYDDVSEDSVVFSLLREEFV